MVTTWLLLQLVVSATLVDGHNWVQSPSRVPLAADVFPCLGKRSALPHVQVAIGQEFQVEWSSGHDRPTTFVLIRKEDASQLVLDSSKGGVVQAYLDAAPPAARQLDPSLSPMLCANCKYHRSKKLASQTHVLGGTVGSHYGAGGEITSGPFYRPRPTEFGTGTFHQYAYISSPNDAYVQYNNPQYPWIKAVWRYEIQEADPGEWDFAVMHVPSSEGAGDFILHYLWSGYYDCIDINVVNSSVSTTPLPYPYGKPPSGPSVVANRIDHCMFDTPEAYTSFPRPLYWGFEDSAKGCLKNCIDTFDSGCSGVTAFPLSLVSKNWGPHWDPMNNVLKELYETAWDVNGHFWDTLFFNKNDGFPRDYMGPGSTVYSGIWRLGFVNSGGFFQWRSVNQTTLDTLRTFVESGTGQADPWTCIYVTARTPTTTVDKYTVVDDPLDPVWYSTCYEVVPTLEFIGFNISDPVSPEVPYAHIPSTGSGCIACQDAQHWAEESYTPQWTLAATCVQCEKSSQVFSFRPDYPSALAYPAQFYFPESMASNDASCKHPSQFRSFSDYCLIPHMWTHPLLANREADPGGYWPWWTGPTNYPSVGTRVGWQTSLVEWTTESIQLGLIALKFCSMLLSKDPLCSHLGGFIDTAGYPYAMDTGCRCVRDDPCCLKYTAFSPTAGKPRTIFEAKPSPTALDPTCSAATSLPSANRKYCCYVAPGSSCNSPGCDENGGGASARPGSLCQGWLIPAERCCSKYAPPCALTC